MTGSVHKDSNRNTMALTGKISITETSCHPLRVGKLELNINHHNIAFKGKKNDKVRVVKALILQ